MATFAVVVVVVVVVAAAAAAADNYGANRGEGFRLATQSYIPSSA